MSDGDREQVGETEVQRPPIAGVGREEITIPGTLRLTCVACEDRRFFNPDHNTEDGLMYACEDCSHQIHLNLTPE
jgi:DNA-directed RNA polymerase subunit RPC12/RpoP